MLACVEDIQDIYEPKHPSANILAIRIKQYSILLIVCQLIVAINCC